MILLRALFGLAVFCGIAWCLSSHKRRFPWRVVTFGLVLQFTLGWIVLNTRAGQLAVDTAASFVGKVISLNGPGATFVFGPVADPGQMFPVFGPDGAFVFAFAGTGLVAIIFFSAVMAILYHLGVMQFLVWCMARVMSAAMGVSGAESMAVAANVFVGQTEAPLVVKPYLPAMTRSELNALMTGGFATIAGSVLAIYMGLIGADYGPHLLTASVMSAPAAFLVAKIMLPETEQSATAGSVPLEIRRTSHNVIEAAATGTQDGLKLWLNVIAMLVAFLALVALVDWPLGALGEVFGIEGGLSLSRIFGWVLAPLAFVMGIDGWHDAQLFGSLMGIKVAANEFVAFKEMIGFLPESGAETVFEHPRSAAMAAFALCGFANFASIGIQIGGIAPLAPDRKKDLSQLALRAMIGGALASWMTATIAGVFLAVEPPTGLAYPITELVVTEGEEVSVPAPTVEGDVTGFRVVPPLPAGLSLSGSDGRITGAADDPFPRTDFVVSAYNPGGTSKFTIAVEVLDDGED